jgi:transcription initiation factor TFIID subunit 6
VRNFQCGWLSGCFSGAVVQSQSILSSPSEAQKKFQLAQVVMSQPAFAAITAIAQSLGIPHLKEVVASLIAQDAKRFLINTLGTAVLYRQTTRCNTLSFTHINDALQSSDLEPLFGYSGSHNLTLICAGCVDALDLLVYEDRQIHLDSVSRLDLIYPLRIAVDCEWLSVVGIPVFEPIEEEDVNEQVFTEKSEIKGGPIQMVQRSRHEAEMVVPSSKHIFSYELQLYHHTSRTHLLSGDIKKREGMLYQLRREQCLETLFPYYLQFCFKLVRDTPTLFEKHYVAVAVCRALTQNEDLNWEIYLDKLISLAMTVLLSAKIGAKMPSEQFLIRDSAAELLRVIMDKAISHYPYIEPTVAGQLVHVLVDDQTAISQKYGALMGLIAFGLNALSEFALQALPLVIDQIAGIEVNRTRMADMRVRVYDAGVKAAGLCIHSDTYMMTATGRLSYSPKSASNYRAVMDTFGADLLPFYMDDSAMLTI